MIRVYADMVSDLFHIGHINFLKQAKILGNYLIVGIHSDKSVASYKRPPIVNESQRYEIVRNCKLVNEVIQDAPLILTKEFIIKHKIDIVVHGSDENSAFEEQHRVPLELGIMRYVNYTTGISTTDIINKILKLYCNEKK